MLYAGFSLEQSAIHYLILVFVFNMSCTSVCVFKLSRIVRAVHLSVALNQSVRVVSVLQRVFPLLNLAITIYIVAFVFSFIIVYF